LFNNGIQTQALNMEQLGKTPEQILREQVFHEAAHRKLNWDRCMEDVFDGFESNQNFMDQWMVTSLRAYLNYKKSEAFRKTCERKFWNYCDPEYTRMARTLNGPREDGVSEQQECWEFMFEDPNGPNIYDIESYFNSREEAETLKQICFDPEHQRAMAVAPYIFKRTVPFFASDDVFDAWERNSNLILDDRTGEPISDAALMNMDFTDGFGGEIRMAENWIGPMRESMGRVLERTRANGQEDRDVLERMINRADPMDHTDLVRPNPAIDPDEYFLHDTLYEQGYFAEVLEDRDLIDRDAIGGSSRMTPEAVCFMGAYHESLGGELAEMALLGVATAGVGTGFQLIRGGAAALRGLATLRGTMSVGATAL
ncbi:MAG: hypothetical protein AAF202_13300, partial [Pseudomonadota bacterium]